METTFHSNKKQARTNTAWVAGFAAVVATGYMYFGAGFRNVFALIAVALGSIILAYGVYWVRGLVGGARAISFSHDQITIQRKKGVVVLPWDDVKEAKFETVNTTPWLTFYANNKKKCRIGLEDFDEKVRKDITDLVMHKIPEKTTSTEDWIIMNRIPISLVKKGIKIIKK